MAGDHRDEPELIARYSDVLKPNYVQNVFGGRMVVRVVPPTNWIYMPATREQEQQAKILAIYHHPAIDFGSLHLYVTLIPREVREPMDLDGEIDADIHTSKGLGLTLINVYRFSTQRGDNAAVTTWNGDGFFRTLGIIACKLGVVMIPGTSRLPAHNQQLADAVLEVTKNATFLRNVHVSDQRD